MLGIFVVITCKNPCIHTLRGFYKSIDMMSLGSYVVKRKLISNEYCFLRQLLDLAFHIWNTIHEAMVKIFPYFLTVVFYL